MHRLLVAILVVLSACAASPTGSPNGCNCQGAPAAGFGYSSFGASRFADTDEDGIPDRRLPDEPGTDAASAIEDQVRTAINRASHAVAVAADRQQLEAALTGLGEALVDAQRKLAASK